MDISKFNKELSYKVAKANGFEKNDKIQEAIDEWLDISEMVLKASKTPKLEFSYKSMLIEKTKQIIEHIKSLKIKLKGYKEQISHVDDIFYEDELQIEEENSNEVETQNTILSDLDIPDLKGTDEKQEVSVEQHKEATSEDIEFKNLPKGFKEIKAPKDYEIITPHDKDYVKDLLNQDIDMSIFKHNGEITQYQDSVEVPPNRPTSKDGKLICFACGSELPSNTKSCPNCGTQIKK